MAGAAWDSFEHEEMLLATYPEHSPAARQICSLLQAFWDAGCRSDYLEIVSVREELLRMKQKFGAAYLQATKVAGGGWSPVRLMAAQVLATAPFMMGGEAEVTAQAALMSSLIIRYLEAGLGTVAARQ